MCENKALLQIEIITNVDIDNTSKRIISSLIKEEWQIDGIYQIDNSSKIKIILSRYF